MVVRKLAQIGNSKGVILPQLVLDMLGWESDITLQLKLDGRKLILSPVAEEAKPAAEKKHRRKKPPES